MDAITEEAAAVFLYILNDNLGVSNKLERKPFSGPSNWSGGGRQVPLTAGSPAWGQAGQKPGELVGGDQHPILYRRSRESVEGK